MKKTIKITIIFLIIIAIICFLVLLKNKKKESESNEEKPNPPEERYNGTKEKYECNEFEFVNITAESLMQTYFNKYKNTILTNPEKAYDMLENEYKQKKFGSIENFKKYAEDNYEKLTNSNLTKYQIDDTNKEYTRYICADEYENYYIFEEKAIMQFTIILDTYTIDQPEFIEKYDETNEKGKCILNIEKVKQALNSGDYEYIYGKLNEQFKNKNYSTLSAFENYMKSNLNKYNKIEYKEFKNEGETYIYNVELTDLLGKTDKTINMQILMQLKDDRDFVMSFSIK